MLPLYDMGHRNECCVTDIMSVQQFLPLTSKCDHDLGAMNLGVTHRLMMVNSSVESFQNSSRKGKVLDWTRKTNALFLTCDL